MDFDRRTTVPFGILTSISPDPVLLAGLAVLSWATTPAARLVNAEMAETTSAPSTKSSIPTISPTFLEGAWHYSLPTLSKHPRHEIKDRMKSTIEPLTSMTASYAWLAAHASVTQQNIPVAMRMMTNVAPPEMIFASRRSPLLPKSSPIADAERTQMTTRSSPLPITFSRVAPPAVPRGGSVRTRMSQAIKSGSMNTPAPNVTHRMILAAN